MPSIRPLLLLTSLCLCPVALLSADSHRKDPPLADPNFVYVAERQRFIEARSALAAGSMDSFESLYTSLKDYPLQPYLHHERLAKKWRSERPGANAIAELDGFAELKNQTSLTRKLTRILQRPLAASLPCTVLEAKHELGKLDGFDDSSLKLWVQAKKHPEKCAEALTHLETISTVPIVSIWEKIYTAMEANKPAHAEPVLNYLASRDRALVKQWIESKDNPVPFLTSGDLREDTVLNRRIIADLVVEWSRDDTTAAMNHWLKVRDSYLFYKDRFYDTSRAIAMRSAYRRMPEAQDWLYTFVNKPDDLELQEWRIRTALLAEDWEAVVKSISELPQVEQEEDHWAYWVARALQLDGKESEANLIYSRLAKLQSYHGFLSADQLDQPYAIYDEPLIVERSLLNELANDPELLQAREFHYVQLPHESRRVWNNWLSNQSPENLAAGAVLASHWSLYDRAIFTAGKTEQKRAISVRFPVLYRPDVARAALENRIDPAWIFGVMRRESAYIRDIKSGAGAVGLMQLMPNTAKFVARLKGDADWRGDLTKAETNIDFGAFYLRHVMDKFDDHQVLATASYNAGPHRITQWLGDNVLDADIWIDTIPFTETRRYVRAVLAYAAIYEYRLNGKPQTLASKLKRVPAGADT